MKCKICEEKFDTKYRIPRNLTCGHCFCEQCLKIYQKNEELECPKCAKKSPLKVPICYAIFELIDGDDTSKKNDFCHLHTLEKLQFTCKNDNTIICSKCLLTNHNGHFVSSLKENTIVSQIQKDFETFKNNIKEKNNFLLNFKLEIEKCEDFLDKMYENQKIKLNDVQNSFNSKKKEKLEELNKTIEINYLNQTDILNKLISEIEFKKNYIDIYSTKIQELLQSFSKIHN